MSLNLYHSNPSNGGCLVHLFPHHPRVAVQWCVYNSRLKVMRMTLTQWSCRAESQIPTWEVSCMWQVKGGGQTKFYLKQGLTEELYKTIAAHLSCLNSWSPDIVLSLGLSLGLLGVTVQWNWQREGAHQQSNK